MEKFAILWELKESGNIHCLQTVLTKEIKEYTIANNFLILLPLSFYSSKY